MNRGLSKLDEPIKLDDALLLIFAAVDEDDAVCIVRMGSEQEATPGISFGAMEVIHAPLFAVIELVTSPDIVDACWTDHELFGECVVVSRQCDHHPENPLDREMYYFTTVRKS